MNLSFDKKFLYIACHKTGSSSIRKSLKPYSDINSEGEKPPYSYHATAGELKPHLEELNYNWEDFFTFTIVRNPWAAQLSFWKYILKESTNQDHPHHKTFLKMFNNFKTFKNWLSNGGGLQPWSHWYSNEHGDNLLSYIGKLENLQTDFDFICDKIGIPRQKLPHVNKTKHKHYTEYYDNETKQIVAEKYAKDIEYFGYKFGE